MHRALATYGGRAADDEPEALIARYGTLIERTARRIVARIGLDSVYDDLWSAGALGLIEAKRRFDAGKGASFETFASHRIRGAMIDELRKMDHLPRRMRARMDDLEKTRGRLQQELGRAANPEEVAQALEIDMDELAGMEALQEPHVPLDSVIPLLATDGIIDDAIDRTRIVAALAGAIEKLPERLQILVALHYQEGLSYREISRIFEVSEPRVCQLHAEAMRQLRSTLESADNDLTKE